MNIETWFLVIYFIAMAGIGVWTLTIGTKDNEGFLLGGRSLGPAVTALRLQSSSMSGYMFLGAGSLAYTKGYFSLWYAMGDIGGGVLNLSILGRRMRKLSQILGSLTSIEYLEHRYPSKWIRAIAAPIALFCIFFYVLAQFIAGGRGLEMVTGISYGWALFIAVGVIVFYTFLGGYLAVAYTDFVQAIIMLIGMLWILIGTMRAVGGWTAGNEAVGEINPNLLTMWGPDGIGSVQWGVIIGAVLVFSIGYMGWPHVNVSHMAMKKPSVARAASMYATGFNLLFIPAPYIVGVMALIILPTLDNPELAVFQVADTVLPDFAVGIVMAGIMAAIMSTADALLLQSGTIASQDLMQRFFIRNLSDRQSVWVSRITVFVLAAIGYLVAVNDPPAVAEVVIFSTTVLGAAFVPVYIAAAWWKKANVPGAIASMLAGTVSSVVWQLTGLVDSTGVDPMGIGIVCSTLGIIVVSLATQRSHPVPEHVVAAMAETDRIGPIPAHMLTGQNDALAGQVPRNA
ncbi:sodium/proline symporter [Brevibacterium sanguinis]|uniref:Sodium/proline symporter n=2 Tax=Brevibacterium TaxID=1696 RepID=A0A366IID6_9MICO|nr:MULTISPECIES: sodium/proline symporter [Brevibacterium]RBP63625.1 sodium/proline symporter [Brevibacterium sanguinis]RBP70284.1 sodium/proline symporter [Brevibacterium celere]